MKKYHLEGLAVISLGIILLIVFVLKVGFNIPPTQNTAAVIGSITSSKTPILNRIDKPVPLNKFQVFLMGGASESTTNPHFNDIFSSFDGQNWKLISPQNSTTTSKWSPRMYFGANTVFFNNKMWVIGGVGRNPTGANQVWSSGDGINWTFVPSNAPNTCEQNIVVFNNKMWIVSSSGINQGYYCGNIGYPQSHLYSSPDGITWTAQTSVAPWGYLDWSSAVVFQGKIIVMGGRGYNSMYSRNTIWSSTDGTSWTHVDTDQSTAGIQDAPWGPRDNFTSLVFNNKIWILGGRYGNGTIEQAILTDDIWSSTNGINWTLELANPPWSRHYQYSGGPYLKGILFGHSSFVLNNKMFIVHGKEPSQICNTPGNCGLYGQIWSSPDGLNWTQVIPTGDPIPSRYGLSTVVVPVSNSQI